MGSSKREILSSVIRYTVVLTPEAEADLKKGYDWYLEYSLASANAWRVRVVDAIEYVGRSPVTPKIWHRDLRILHVKQSKYSIIYRVKEQTVTIASAARSRMNDERWCDR